MDKFAGKWEVTSTEKMDEMLKAVGMDEEKIKMYGEIKPVFGYTKDGDYWVGDIVLPNGQVVKTSKFKVGEPFDTTSIDQRPVKSLVELKDGKMVETFTDANDATLSMTVTREIVNDELIMKVTARGITGITKHKRL